ncbi:secreted RxLR effector protein 161-like [Coffea arabica]|uniref:Secreted RxLR effector protein 161-like n=1 Tax=Coffea arabica TaxID=13443 RepID=A0ABM4X872_COFAR
MIELGYNRSQCDCYVYHNKLEDGSMIYLILYVDNMLIVVRNKADIQKLKSFLSAEFEMKDLCAAQKILGMEIFRDRSQKKLFLSQKSYIENSEAEIEYMAKVPYSSAVGSLIYVMVCIRPDLAHAVSVVSRFMANPGKERWLAVKRIFRYLRDASDVGLIYGGDIECLITGYSDSDYTGDIDSRRSMAGYVFTFGHSVASWKATLQPTVTLSTIEAEYMALTVATKEGIWLRGLVGDLGLH